MKKIILFVLCISFISFVKKDTIDDVIPYFEGQVIFDIEYTPYNENIPAERLKEFLGSKVVLTFKKGNFKKDYFSPNGDIVQQRYLKVKDEISYLKTNLSDTINWFHTNINDTKTTFKVQKDSVFKGHPCKVITTNSIVSIDSSSDKTVEVEGLFMYAQDLPINPDWYAKYYEGNYNEMIKVGKGITIVTVNKGVYWEQKITLKKVIKRKVKNKELKLKISKDTPLKEL